MFSQFDTSLIDWNEAIALFRSIGSESLAKAAQRLVPASQFSIEAEVVEPEEPEEKEPVVVEQLDADTAQLENTLSALSDNAHVAIQVLLSEEDEMRASIIEIRRTGDGSHMPNCLP